MQDNSAVWQLLKKYNVPVPRYTSYPTVPFWDSDIDRKVWVNDCRKRFSVNNLSEGISVYVHLPFCESLCTYCGCNKRITTNHDVEDPYINAVLKEWQMYLEILPGMPVLRELHLGGGTPTFFSVDNLSRLINGIVSTVHLHEEYEFSFEGHPNNTTYHQLVALYKLGFRRVSFGVQDNDPVVQKAINRIQPIGNAKRVTEQARAIGYLSINFDLIYGLPFQTLSSIRNTVNTTLSLRPDRVAFYSYAHVPWNSRGQRLFDEHDLPSADEKLKLYLEGKKLFTAAGYADIGMDHFALPGDDLYQAWEENTLHRNFMGYTTQRSSMLIGLGVSSISDTGTAYAQNQKALRDYYACIERNQLPVAKGYFLSPEDVAFKKYILELICQGSTTFQYEYRQLLNEYSMPALQALQQDGLLKLNEQGIELTDVGRQFVRIICSAFDLHLLRSTSGQQATLFSRAV